MGKLISFKNLKELQKLPLNSFNRWVESIYESGKQDGIDFVSQETVAEVGENELYNILLSVKGIGPTRAMQVMRKIVSEDWEVCDESQA